MPLRPWWPTPFVGLLGGWLASLVHWPLPWITGALIAVTLCCLGWRITAIAPRPPRGAMADRHGHWAALHPGGTDRGRQAPAADGLGSDCHATAGAGGYHRRAAPGTERKTAFFAFMPANFAEMINLAERHGADVPEVAAAHTLRLVIIVLVVPFAMLWGVPVIAHAGHVPPLPASSPAMGVALRCASLT
ncbi:putative membrane protein AbrB (regulator of aidB expression) [Pseudomonas oryzihabitans]